MSNHSAEVAAAESAVVEVGPVAHGGHCVARHDGRVIFVRHALPGEIVRVKITDASHDRFWRADAVEVLAPSPDRVTAPCPVAGPGLCGGCDFQHVALPVQRQLKAQVVSEQLERLAGIAWTGTVEALPEADHDQVGAGAGLGWRTRMRYQLDEQGRPGLREHRSHRVVGLPTDGCRIAAAELARPSAGCAATEELVGVRPSVGDVVWLTGDTTAPEVVEQVGERRFGLCADGFWQVHPAAAATLLDAVLDGLRPQPGESAVDLYCGVGLFAAGLADAGCRPVLGIESGRRAVVAARENLASSPGVTFLAGRVEPMLQGTRRGVPSRTDLVVLDPPRTGAGRRVVEAVAARRPRAVAYVACDPAALARDLKTFDAIGYRPDSIRAFDLFPMTHHVECVAVLQRATA